MRLSRIAAFVLLGSTLLPLSGVLPESAVAQDEEEAEEAPEQTGPPIEDPIRFTDRKSLTEWQLPRDWKSEKVDESRGELGRWQWVVNDGAIAGSLIYQVTGSMRASLYRARKGGGKLEVVEGSVESGKGWSQQRLIDERGLTYLERYVEKDGIIWVAHFICHKNNWELCRPVAEQAMTTFKVVGKYARKSVAADWTKKKLKDYLVLTNVDADKVDKAVALVEPLVEMRKYAQKVLPGKPYMPAPWRVLVVLQGSIYEKTAVANTGGKPDVGVYDPVERGLLVKWMAQNNQGFDELLMSRGAGQIVTEHFGGAPPFWISVGLRSYVQHLHADGGKPTKPDKERMRRQVKPRVQGATKRLDQWFKATGSDVPENEINAVGFELYGWHWFFRHAKQGKKWRKTYEKSLQILRDTGDPEAAEAAWDGADFGAMRDAFKKWGKGL